MAGVTSAVTAILTNGTTTTPEPQKATAWLDNRNNVATFLVLPAFVLFIGGCCSIYGCFQARRYCKRKKKQRMQKLFDEQAMIADAQKQGLGTQAVMGMAVENVEEGVSTAVGGVEKAGSSALTVEVVENFETEEKNLKQASEGSEAVAKPVVAKKGLNGNLDTDSGIGSPKGSGRNSPNENTALAASTQKQALQDRTEPQLPGTPILQPIDSNSKEVAATVIIAKKVKDIPPISDKKVEGAPDTGSKKSKKKKKKKAEEASANASVVAVTAAVVASTDKKPEEPGNKPKGPGAAVEPGQDQAEKPKKAKKKKKEKLATGEEKQEVSSARKKKKVPTATLR